jgi:predicted lipoprotein with Yx(FWY)xxD motif
MKGNDTLGGRRASGLAGSAGPGRGHDTGDRDAEGRTARPGGLRTRTGGSLIVLAAVAAMLVAACSSGSAAGAGGGATAAAAAPATAAPAATADTLSDYGRAPAATEAPAASAEAEGGEAYEVGMATDASVGPYLTGEKGMTLYIFKKDSPGKSVCTDQCAANWPPFTLGAGETVNAAAGISGTFGTITRPDGTTQVTYKDQPLYYYVADKKAGDVTGQGVGGVWYVAAP